MKLLSLKRMLAVWNRKEREKINENWTDIERGFSAANTAINTAQETAEDGVTRAKNAQATADDATKKAVAAQETATTADNKADDAVETANNASIVANDIDGKATEALNKSKQAVSTSNTARDTAQQAKTTADTTAKQINDVIKETGDTNAEVIASRTDAYLEAEFNTSGMRMDSLSARISITVSDILNDFANSSLNTIYHTNGFYKINDATSAKFRVEAVNGNEKYKNIGNGILVGEDCSIKIDNNKKLVLIHDAEKIDARVLGAKAGDNTIDNAIIANAIFLNAAECSFGKGRYYIKTSILHRATSILSGFSQFDTEIYLADSALCYIIKSPTSDLDNNVRLYNKLVIRDIKLHGNHTNNTKRTYGANTSLGYWGFGVHVSNIKEFEVENVEVHETNAYGIAYYLCDKVKVRNIRFWQKASNGTNGDGISGTAYHVDIDGVSGYTNDDMIAVGVGGGSLQGNAGGLNAYINVESVSIKNVTCEERDGYATHVAIGLYPHLDHEIKVVDIKDVRGVTRHMPIRLQNYWYSAEKTLGSCGKLSVKNVSVVPKEASVDYCLLLSSAKVDVVEFGDSVVYHNEPKNMYYVHTKNSSVGNMFIKNMIIYDSVAEKKTALLSQDADSSLRSLLVDDITIINSVEKMFSVAVLHAGVRYLDIRKVEGTNVINYDSSFIYGDGLQKIPYFNAQRVALDFDTFFDLGERIVNVTKKEARIKDGELHIILTCDLTYDITIKSDVTLLTSKYKLLNFVPNVSSYHALATGVDMLEKTTIVNDANAIKLSHATLSSLNLNDGTYKLIVQYKCKLA